MAEKWYSGGLTSEEANKLEKLYAKIEKPTYGLTDRNDLALQFVLESENGSVAGCKLFSSEDIKELFMRTHTSETSQLAGKVIETFSEGKELGVLLRGISVNPYLV